MDVAQLVRVADCGSVGRGFESHLPPKADCLYKKTELENLIRSFLLFIVAIPVPVNSG